ncbi:MAG: DUF99 family protein [Archaeoglobales archaeon]|nr:DUF99 family protein [Archaeoglobales archaeon]
MDETENIHGYKSRVLKIRVVKKWRFVGFDDSFKGSKACIFGCVTCDNQVEGFMYEEIEVDGFDVTEKIVSLVLKSKFRNQLKCIFLAGLTFAGFNVADIVEIYNRTSIPVVVIMRREPKIEEFISAARKLEKGEERLKIIERAGKVEKIGTLYVQLAGINLKMAEEYIELSKLKGKVPEALRIAHLAASAVIHGESKGKA